MSGLAFFGLDFVTKLGVGSALGVLTTVLMANSLLIAVLAKLGHRVRRMSAGFHVLLYVVTLGFYGWYWAYRAQRGTRRRTEGVGGPFGLLIWIVIPAVSASHSVPGQAGIREGRSRRPLCEVGRVSGSSRSASSSSRRSSGS